MGFDFKQYVSNILDRSISGRAVLTLNKDTHKQSICACCGSNVSGDIKYNKGIHIGQLTNVKSDHEIDARDYGATYPWPKAEFYEADLSELVGQTLKYEVVIQKEFTDYYKTNLEKPYDSTKN